jgi:ABC-type nitrate/sulfonate/bicarbonate transport system ATPase subunit
MTEASAPVEPDLALRPESEGLEFDNISHTYVAANGTTPVLADVRFSVGPGKIACVVGPSGCGKSTLLSLAAGLMTPTSGTTRWRGQPVKPGTNLDLGMAFQQPGLFPWMTVRQNVAIGLTTRGSSRVAALRGADEMLEKVGLSASTMPIRASSPGAWRNASASRARWRCDRRCS